MAKEPFIPADKPKFWVIGVLAGLIGMAIGLVAFASAYLAPAFAKWVCFPLFMLCWATFAVCWLGAAFGLFTGRYRHLQSRSWHEQVW
jgi:hypothetical protein